MITVDISNVWGQTDLQDLLAIEAEASNAYQMLIERNGAGSEYLDWMDLPEQSDEEIEKILAAAEKIRKDSDVCVIVGIGGSYLGPRAAIELLQGSNRNIGKGKGDPQIFFAGNNLSTRHWNELMGLLNGKDFSVIIISKSGTTTEPAIAFRGLRFLLERRYGTDAARERIYAITDPEKGALRQMVQEQKWQAFPIGAGVGGRFSVLSPVGLLPMAVAGIDIKAMLQGSAEAKASYSDCSLDNPVWLYAATRNMLYRNGKVIELLESFEPSFKMFAGWWQQLMGESEGKDGKGIFPATAELTADLHSLGQLIQEGERNLFETMVRFDPPELELTVLGDVQNLDNLNYLEGKTLSYVEEQACLGTIMAHSDGGVPVITVDCGELNAQTVGELFYFFQLSCGVSAYILGVNPFNQPGVEAYKQNMFRLLGKPQPEEV